jgi:1,2-diacylglycerol 3-alpha-glucosyltransferase
MPLIEAEAHSIPVLARRGSAMDELIIEGYNGYLFDNINEISTLFEKIKNDYNNFSYNAYMHSKNYTNSKYKQKYFEILEKYMNNI